MLSKAQNELACRTGADTPGGKLFRQYWHPIAMATDFPADGAPLPIKVLGEELVLFKDEAGKLGLLGLHCPHRGGDLSYGRIEDGGLRCIYHGWVFDVNGKCLQQPAEPPGQEFCHKIKQKAYPVRELGGMIFAYLGAGEPPVLPEWECLTAAPEHRYVVRSYERCNYLQGLEGDIDPYHLSFLHLAMKRDIQARGSNEAPHYEFFRRGIPRMEIEYTDFGVRIYGMRDLDNRSYLRLSNYMCPNMAAVAGGGEGDGYMMLWHVPVDDVSHFKYRLDFRRNEKAPKYDDEMQWTPGVGNRTQRTQENRWLQDRAQMKEQWFAGLGGDFGLHDNWATEAMGPIYDRSEEHLGHGDKAIIGARKSLLAAIESFAAGKGAPFRYTDPQALREKMTEIVVTALIAPDKDKYKEVFHEHHIAARQIAAKSAAE